MPRLDDTAREWVRAAQTGDVPAFERLFRHFGGAVYSYLAHLLDTPQEAEDATQIAFVRAWEKLPRLREAEAFEGWLYSIARNVARDQTRAHRGSVDLREAESLPSPDPEAQLDETLLFGERQERVRAAVASLPDHHREVVALYHLQELPVEEIAGIIGAPVGTVVSRLSRARDTLRRKLATLVDE